MHRQPLNANPDDDPPVDDAAEDAALYERQSQQRQLALAAELEQSSNGQMTRVMALSIAARLVRGLRQRSEPMSKSPRWFRDLVLTELRTERAARGLPRLTMVEEDVVEQAADTTHRMAIDEDRQAGRPTRERRVPITRHMGVVA